MNAAPPTPVPYPFTGSHGLDVHEAYAAARAADGMIRVQLPYGEPAWLATRYEDVRFVMGDARFSRAMSVQPGEPRYTPAVSETTIISFDAPEHTRLRTPVVRAFSRLRVEDMRPWVRKVADELLDAMIAGGDRGDLVGGFALPLPIAILCELLGVPDADRPQFREWSDAALSTSPLPAEEREQRIMALYGYLAARVAAARGAEEPQQHDLLSALVAAQDPEDELSEQELTELVLGIVFSGYETTASMFPDCVHVLLGHPDEWAALVADPELIPTAVEELVRFVPMGIGGAFPRYAKEDVEVGGVLVRAGEPVLPVIYAANRDAGQFPEPDAIRLDRSANQHLSFGHGAHYCLGSRLARVELQEALHALVTKMPELKAVEDIQWKESVIRSPERMVVSW
ncbi:cytochrome P450 [Streptomyces sp. NPDC088733]|uniref:cytochrome P450 n=1 Tax=Streptomyces sp. NPDC088733 TaxID=3365880 RepID=UPI003820A385